MRTSRDDLFLDPSSYRRYDRYAQAVSSIDARGAARLYATLKPRILDAYRRMGQPTAEFDPVLERAIVELLSVPAVQGEIELAPSGIVYAFVDPRLESMSAAQKHLLRMGPENVRAIQGKLREIADYLGIPAAGFHAPPCEGQRVVVRLFHTDLTDDSSTRRANRPSLVWHSTCASVSCSRMRETMGEGSPNNLAACSRVNDSPCISANSP